MKADLMQKSSLGKRLKDDMRRNASLYLLVLPVLAFYIIFCYKPMYGAIIAFKRYSPGAGIWGSPWVGFQNFIELFQSADFARIFKNTVVISLANIVVGFPAPIILALLINEMKIGPFRKITQTVSYMPHFISLVVICALIRNFVGNGGFIQQIVRFFGGPDGSMLNRSEYFVPIHVLSGIWQEVGWGSIIYIAALSGIDQQKYEAAQIDGAGKWKQMLYVTLPGLKPTIIIMLILRLGSVLSVGYEKIILLYNPLIYETSDVISTYVYRTGFESQDWSYSTAVGLFNSVINFVILIIANSLSKKFGETSLF